MEVKGLLGATPAQQPAPQRGPADPMAAGADQPNVTPEEQAEYEQFVNRGYEVVYDETVAPKILQMIEKAEPKTSGLASATVGVVIRVEDAARQKGAPVSKDVVLHGGAEILSDIADFSAHAGVYQFSPDEIETATYAAVDLYGAQAMDMGLIDKEATMADYNAMVQANEQGRLDDVLPGASEAAARFQKNSGQKNSGGAR